MTSFEKSVKGATKVKIAAPKSKYIEHILIATHAGEAGIAEVFRALNNRMKDQTWTIVFKSLIVVHLMIREGEQDVTLRYLRKHPRLVAISNYSDVQEQGRNIRRYSMYLAERARSYGEVKIDFVRSGQGRLRKLSVDKGLLREVDCVQLQLRSLLQCNFAQGDVDNEITLTAFRMLVSDLLAFFHVVNEGVINVLEHYFEMSRVDAERSLEIYKTFTRQTEDTVEFLQNARRLETATRLQIPNVKHAPTSLTNSLEEYLNDPDFETNRRTYLTQQEAKKNGGKVPANTKAAVSRTAKPTTLEQSSTVSASGNNAQQISDQQTQSAPPKVERDLIDFFASIENEQTSMFNQSSAPQTQFSQGQQPQFAASSQSYAPTQPFRQFQSQIPINQGFTQQAQPSGFQYPTSNTAPIQTQIIPAQPTMAPLSNSYTGAGFGGYTTIQEAYATPMLQSIQENQNVSNFQYASQAQNQNIVPNALVAMPTGTNPFRQSAMPTGASNTSGSTSLTTNSTGVIRNTNPFARSTAASSITSEIPVTNMEMMNQPQVLPIQQPLRATPTGTNPFARSIPQTTNTMLQDVSSAPAASFQDQTSLMPQATGTNPFRQSRVATDQTGQWNNNQTTIGGFSTSNLQSIPVFPSSMQEQEQQQFLLQQQQQQQQQPQSQQFPNYQGIQQPTQQTWGNHFG